jgi:flavin reductase (DIM6/NTAB) family NADH-FMN oxidoreductase RutF
MIPFQSASWLERISELGAAEHFAVNALAEHQSAPSTRLAKALTDKWKDIEFAIDQHGSPVLPGTLAVISCTSHAGLDGGITSSWLDE